MEILSPTFAVHPARIALPLVAALVIGAEYLASRRKNRNAYDACETAATLAIAVGGRLIGAATVGIGALPMSWAYQHRLFDLSLKSPWWLLALFVGVEFCYYWHHRAMHRVNWFWATHAVHHSSTKINLSAALRLGWGGNVTGGFLFYLPLVFLGFDPLAVVATLGAGLAFQFFLHVAEAPHLGPLEWLLNTPAHHHVHHAANDACLDKNFGAVLIVFDRLFGTFAEAPVGETLRFGLKGEGPPAGRPLAIVLAGWHSLIRLWCGAPTWSDRRAALFGRPR